MDDLVFKALADPNRRALLDALYHNDGQSLTGLEALLPMTRFGVMKHLKVLETAALVVTRRCGREKLHFLNAVPIRLLYGRWVSKYSEVGTAAPGDSRTRLQQPLEKVYEIYIKTTPGQLWQAITDTETRRKYNFGVSVTSDFTQGARYQGSGGGRVILEGETLTTDPPRCLVQSYRAMWSDAVRREGTSRVTWEIQPVGDSCLLKVTHDQLREGANTELYGGWPMLLSGLKTWLETGAILTTPGSLRWLEGNEDYMRGVGRD